MLEPRLGAKEEVEEVEEEEEPEVLLPRAVAVAAGGSSPLNHLGGEARLPLPNPAHHLVVVDGEMPPPVINQIVDGEINLQHHPVEVDGGEIANHPPLLLPGEHQESPSGELLLLPPTPCGEARVVVAPAAIVQPPAIPPQSVDGTTAVKPHARLAASHPPPLTYPVH